jgi:hypothetical protein
VKTHAERVLRALAACRRQHGIVDPVEALGKVQSRSERARRRADMAEQTWQARQRWLDTWAKTWREAIALGLEPESIPQNADEDLIRKRGSALWAQVKAKRKELKELEGG